MPMINCKIQLKLNWIEHCIVSGPGDSVKFKTAGDKVHVPIFTLSAKDNLNLTRQLSNGFKRSVYWNNYQTILEKTINPGTNMYELLHASFQGVERLFQNQPPRGVLRKRCSENMQEIYRRTSRSKCDSNKVALATLLISHFGMVVLM